MQKKSKSRIPLNIIMLGLVSFFTDVSSEMIYPLIPVFVALIGSGAIILGIIEGVAETTASLLKLFSGIFSDKFKKKKLFILIGYSISTIARPLISVVSHGWQIVLVRMLDRTGKGIRTAPRDALIASSVNEDIRGKAYGFHRAMDHTGATFGPLISIVILFLLFAVFKLQSIELVLRWTFALALIPGLISILVIIFFIKEKEAINNKISKFKFSFSQFDKNFKVYLSILVLFTLGNSSDAFLLFRVQEAVGKSGVIVSLTENIGPLKKLISQFGDLETQKKALNILILPLIWSFFHVFKVIFSTPFGSLSDRIGRKKVINIGWGVYAFVYFGFAMLDFIPQGLQLPAIFILFLIYSFYYALTEGAEKALVADLVSEEYRGSAFGMYHFVIGIGALPASVIFGVIYSGLGHYGGMAAFLFGSTLAFVSMILLAIKIKK